jgi:hypothetical protein
MFGWSSGETFCCGGLWRYGHAVEEEQETGNGGKKLGF